MLLVQRHPPGPGRHLLPSPGWTTTSSRAAGVVVASATATAGTNRPKEEDSVSRNVSSFQPSIWGDFFLTYSNPLLVDLNSAYFFAIKAQFILSWALIYHASENISSGMDGTSSRTTEGRSGKTDNSFKFL